MLRVGLISDTHDLLRPPVVNFLRGSDHIIHAGDICNPTIIEALSLLAPVTAVLGNNDEGPWCAHLRRTERIELGAVTLYIIHDLAELDIDPVAAGVQVVVSGHSHKPQVRNRERTLYVNPGSAGPRRFRLPIAAAELLIQGSDVKARIAEFTATSSA